MAAAAHAWSAGALAPNTEVPYTSGKADQSCAHHCATSSQTKGLTPPPCMQSRAAATFKIPDAECNICQSHAKPSTLARMFTPAHTHTHTYTNTHTHTYTLTNTLNCTLKGPPKPPTCANTHTHTYTHMATPSQGLPSPLLVRASVYSSRSSSRRRPQRSKAITCDVAKACFAALQLEGFTPSENQGGELQLFRKPPRAAFEKLGEEDEYRHMGSQLDGGWCACVCVVTL